MKVIDTTHQFRGYHTDGGVCRIQVYSASGLPPLVVATELWENTNTSVTNLAEYLAAEVMERYLTAEQLAGQDPPFIWVERYRRRRPHPTRGEYEDWSLVTFSHYRRERTRSNAPLGGWRYRIGEPDWRHLSRQDFETLLAPYR